MFQYGGKGHGKGAQSTAEEEEGSELSHNVADNDSSYDQTADDEMSYEPEAKDKDSHQPSLDNDHGNVNSRQSDDDTGETTTSDGIETISSDQSSHGKNHPREKDLIADLNDRSESSESSQKQRFSTDVTERWDIAEALQFAEGLSIYHSPDWSKPMVQAATFLINNTGAPEMFPVGPNMSCMDEAVLAGIIQQFSSMPLDRIHHFALNGEFMYALFRDKRLVDILIHVGDKIYYGHRSVICTHSGYFAAILIDNDVPPYKVTDVTLTSVDPYMFKLFLHFAYTGDIFVTLQNMMPLKNLATLLQSDTLRGRLLLFMSKMSLMTLPEALYILCNHLVMDDTALAVEVVKMNFSKVLDDVESLGRLSLEDLIDIISASNVCVNSELDIFWAVLFWVASDPSNRVRLLNRLMKEVRFTSMSSLELLDCARVSRLVRLSKVCKTLLISANWVCHARELGLEDPLNLPLQTMRQCLSEKPHHEPTVAEFDHRFLIYSKLIADNGGNMDIELHRSEASFDNIKDIESFVYPPTDGDAGSLQHEHPLGDKRETETHSGNDGNRIPPQADNQFSDDTPSSSRGQSTTGSKKQPTSKYKSFWNVSKFNDRRKDAPPAVKEDSKKKVQFEDLDDQNASSRTEDPKMDMSLNAPDVAPVVPPLDPILLWESTVLPSTQISLNGGSILQPVILQKLAFSRDPHHKEQPDVDEDGMTTPGTLTDSEDKEINNDVTRVTNPREELTQWASRHDVSVSSESRDNVPPGSTDTSHSQQAGHHMTFRGSTDRKQKSTRRVKKLRKAVKPIVDLMTFD